MPLVEPVPFSYENDDAAHTLSDGAMGHKKSDVMLVASFTEEGASGFGLVQTGITAFKSVVGPAVLYNPHIFAEGGWVFGMCALVIAYMLWGIGVFGIMNVNTALGGGKSYEDLATMAMGKFGFVGVQIAVVLQQFGIVLSYFIFVNSSVVGMGVTVAPWIVIMIMALLQIPFCILPSLETLRPTILMGTIICSLGLVWIIGFLFVTLAEDGVDATCVPLYKDWPLAVGSSVFAFEGSAALALPVHNTIKPALREAGAKVYVGTVACIVVMYIAIGSVGYFDFGVNTETVIINSMPANWTTQLVRVMFAFMVFFTFPFQLFPASTIVADLALGKHGQNPNLGMLFRAVLVLLLGLAAYFLKNSLDHLTALIGSLLGIPLSFMFPAAIHWQLAEQTWFTKTRHVIFLFSGFCAMIFTGYTTISTWGGSKS